MPVYRARVTIVSLLLLCLSLFGTATAGKAAPGRPSLAAQRRLEAAWLQLQQARQVEASTPGKEPELYLQRALDAYNAAWAGVYGPPAEASFTRGSINGGITEVEANNTAAAAQSLDPVLQREGCAVALGEIRAVGDVDFYSFTAPAGARVWAYVDTGGVQRPGGVSRDSVLSLIGTDQSTVIEADDDDGTGNGLDGTLESTTASVISGRVVPSAGTYYLRLVEFNSDSLLAPYRLYVVITTTAAVSESEPNDTTATASTVLPVGAPVGLVRGSAGGADVDLYRLALQAGDIATVEVDEDPTRDGSSSNCALALLNTAGAQIIETADNDPDGSGGESLSFRAVTGGVYYVRVRQSLATAASDYHLLAAVFSRTVGAASAINGVLGSGSEDYPAVSGIQVARVFRNAIPSDCNAPPKAFPGTTDPALAFTFDAYLFKNRSAVEACVTVTLDCFDNANLFCATYSAFDPGSVGAGYLADAGSSTGTGVPVPRPYSLRVAPGDVFVVVVSETGAGETGAAYTLTLGGDDIRSSLVGCPQSFTVPNDLNQAGAVVSYNAPGVTDPSLGPVVCTPASGSFFPLGDTVVTCQDQIGTTCTFTVTVKDVQPPSLTVPNPITANLSQPAGAVVNYSATASDNAPGVSLVCTPASGTVFPLGLTLVSCTATDAAGNTTTRTFPVTVRDTVAPVITAPNSLTVDQTQANGEVVTYAASATDNSGSVTFTSSPSSGTLFPLGPTVVTCTATDSSGNTTVRTFLVTVRDTQSPVITVPAPLSVVQDQAGGAIVNYMVSATDNAGSVNVTSSPASGSFFPLGTTAVTVVAVDSSGNVSQRSFNVTVNPPASTAGVKVTGSGTLSTGTPPAKFKINASVSTTGALKLTFTHTQTSAGLALKNATVSAITRSGNLVRIFGTLRNGAAGALQPFLLEVRDVAKPGANQDTYRLSVKDGFQLAETAISTGEITVK